MPSKDSQSQPPLNEPRVGEQLRRRREEQSLSLAEVVEQTRISLSNLTAIETSAYDRLPADSFTRGLLILYASHLGLDGRATAERFFYERDGGRKSTQTPLQKSMSSQPLTPKIMAEPAHISSAAVAGGILFFIIVSFGGFCLYYSWNPFAYLTNKIPLFSSPVKTAFHPADPATRIGKPQSSLSLQALFLKDALVRITLDDQDPVEHGYTKGTNVNWEAGRLIEVEFFQPDCAELHLNGAPLGFPAAVDGRHLLRVPSASSGK